MGKLRLATLSTAIVCSGGLFGFYFTMSYVIMPGFDASEAYSALHTNQQIGRATQGSPFFLLLLGTPIAIIGAMLLPASDGGSRQVPFLAIALVGWVAMLVVTFSFNVPLNQHLDALELAAGQGGLLEEWKAYSEPWQAWNHLRVWSSAVTLVSCGLALRQGAERSAA